MTPSEHEILAARLTRIKTLVDALEAFAESVEQRELCLKLRAEMDAAHKQFTSMLPPALRAIVKGDD